MFEKVKKKIVAASIMAWLKTQPATPENKALRAQAGIVVDYLKGNDGPKESKLSASVKAARGGDAPVQFKGYA